jgi:hypothetical protein
VALDDAAREAIGVLAAVVLSGATPFSTQFDSAVISSKVEVRTRGAALHGRNVVAAAARIVQHAIEQGGLRLLSLERALVDVSPAFFHQNALAARIALRSVDVTELARVLLAATPPSRPA